MRRLIPAALFLLAACASTTTMGRSTNAAPNSAASPANPYFVCHGGSKPKWKRVAVEALGAHRRHGDRVVSTPQRVNTPCTK